jgi:hypothetical protein
MDELIVGLLYSAISFAIIMAIIIALGRTLEKMIDK